MRRVDSAENPYLRVLLYGKPGSTKTRTAYTAALDDRTFPALALNAAGNPLSTRDYDRKPDILTMDTLADFNAPYNWLAAGQPKDAPFCKEFNLNPPYKCVIVDGVTEVQRMSFDAQRGYVDPGSFPSKVSRDHFYNTLGQMVNFARLYFSLPLHVVMTSLEKESSDQVTGAITYSPLLWGQSDTEVGGYSYVVARLIHRAVLEPKTAVVLEDVLKDSTVSIALFRPSGKYVAKDQYGTLGDYMIDPTIPKMLDLIFGGTNPPKQ